MSHWKTFKNDVLTNTRENMLAKALEEMGVKLDTNIKSIRNSWGNEQVDMGLIKNGRPIALGFKRIEGNKLELHGDFYSTGLNESQFMNTLGQVYKKNDIIDKLENHRYTVDSVETDNDGNVVIEAYTYA